MSDAVAIPEGGEGFPEMPAGEEPENAAETWSGAAIELPTKMAALAGLMLDPGSLEHYDEVLDEFGEYQSQLSYFVDLGFATAKLHDELQAADSSRDMWAATFGASMDVLAASLKNGFMEFAVADLAPAAIVFAETSAAAFGVAVTFPAWATVGVGVAGFLALTYAFDKVYTTELRPGLTDIYKQHINPPNETDQVPGLVQDGPIAGAVVFADANFNGRWDPGEARTVSDADGNFSLNVGQGPIIAVGGTDTLTGIPFHGKLTLRDAERTVTPLTTLIHMMEDNGDLAAANHVASAFNLDPSLTGGLGNYDVLLAVRGGDPRASQVFCAQAELAVAVDLLAADFAGTGRQQNVIRDAYGVFASALEAWRPGFLQEDDLGPARRLNLNWDSPDGFFGARTYVEVMAQIEDVTLTSDEVTAFATAIINAVVEIEKALGFSPPIPVTDPSMPPPPPLIPLTGEDLIAAIAAVEQGAQQALDSAVFRADFAPEIQMSGAAAFRVKENSTAVTKFIATDADMEQLSYSLKGPDARFFKISSFGQLSFVTAPNFERPRDASHTDQYHVSVKVGDGTLSDLQPLFVTVTDISEAVLRGTPLGNSLHGGPGNNIIDGGLGNDVLSGLGGEDTFRFTTKLGTNNVDHIKDFGTGTDSLELSNRVFANLDRGVLPQVLERANFFVGNHAHDADDRIIYSKGTGAIFYDADGTGRGGQIEFAVLDKHPFLSFADILVI